MKKLLVAIAVVVAGLGSSAVAQNKVAHVNTTDLYDTLETRKAAMEQYTDFEKRAYEELQEMQADYDKAVQSFKEREGDLTPTMKEIEYRKIAEKEQRYSVRQQNVQDELMAISDELNQPILDMIQEAIKIVADRKKLAYVLNIQQTLYHAGGMDITDEVMVELVKLDKAEMASKKLGATTTPN
jgi:outer membrane protein